MNDLASSSLILSFFASWNRACSARKALLLNKWSHASLFTAEVFDAENALVEELADELGLHVYTGYYSIDAIFFKPEDRVHCAPPGQTWVQNVRIAFEHENFFNSGLFTEVSHLLITRADLRVLVSYPGNEAELTEELNNLARIISMSDVASDPSFLFITGSRISDNTDILWRGYTFRDHSLMPLSS